MPPKAHLFAVAVEKYRDKTIPNVDFAEADGREFAEAWVDACTDSAEPEVLVNADATKTAILSRFKTFCRSVGRNDVLVFFYAGHGLRLNGANCLTAHDTLMTDLGGTTVALSELLEIVESDCQSARSLLFIDACHSGIPVNSKMRSLIDSFSVTELKTFCADAEYRIGFASCKSDESSFAHGTVKHGLWTYLILQALKGEAKDALQHGKLITGSSLQNYLADSLPILLRNTKSGKVSQTPCIFGNHTKEFEVADLSDLLKRKAEKANFGIAIADSSILGRQSGKIRSLSGFRKPGHVVPTTHTSATEAFVEKIGLNDLESVGKDIFQRLRDKFAYKNRELHYKLDNSTVTITAPDFNVNVELRQDGDDPQLYEIRTEVVEFQSTEVVQQEAFVEVFADFCDTIVVAAKEPIDVGEKINELENVPSLAESLDYGPDNDWLSFELDDPPLSVRITVEGIEIRNSNGRDLALLLHRATDVFKRLQGDGVALLPSAEEE